MEINHRAFVGTIAVLLIIESLSLLSYVFHGLHAVPFFLVVGIIGIIAAWKPSLGIFALFAELVVGGKGYLLQYSIGSFDVSLRLALFIIVIAIWFIREFMRSPRQLIRAPYAVWWLLSFTALGFGIASAFAYGNASSNIFLDANGYLYLAAAGPLFAFCKNRADVEKFFSVYCGAFFVLTAKTLFILLFFAHARSADALRTVYRWISTTGVGEITQFQLGWYRIFFQSHIFALLSLFLGIWLLSSQSFASFSKVTRRVIWGLILFSIFILIVSFSRSFWLSAGMTLVLSGIYYVRMHTWNFRILAKPFLFGLGIVFVELIIVTGLVNLPHKGGEGGISTISMIRERLSGGTEEVAISSRMNLLKPLTQKILEHPFFGSGFGATVTYDTRDPRALEHVGSKYTTYAFEWGYLDFVSKLGMIGALLFMMFPLAIFLSAIRALRSSVGKERALFSGIVFALIALFITHATTPYLNHPLGIGYLLILAAVVAVVEPSSLRTQAKHAV